MSYFPVTTEDLVALLRLHALEYGTPEKEFTLASGQKSHYYLDVRKLTLSSGLVAICNLLDKVLVASNVAFDAVGGPETGANQLVGGYMSYLGAIRPDFTVRRTLRGFTVRKRAKEHGKDGLIVGSLQPGDRVVLLEDVTTTGSSVLSACEVVASVGARVVMAVTVVDRLQGAREALERIGIPFRSLLTIDDVGIEPRRPGVNAPFEPEAKGTTWTYDVPVEAEAVVERLRSCDGRAADAAVVTWEHCQALVHEIDRLRSLEGGKT